MKREREREREDDETKGLNRSFEINQNQIFGFS